MHRYLLKLLGRLSYNAVNSRDKETSSFLGNIRLLQSLVDLCQYANQVHRYYGTSGVVIIGRANRPRGDAPMAQHAVLAIFQ